MNPTSRRSPWRDPAVWFLSLSLLFLAYLIGSPWVAYYQIRSAADNEDAEAMRAVVDFPALRESAKRELSRSIVDSATGSSDAHNPFAAAGEALGMELIGPIVDRMITPEGIIAMIRNGKLRPHPAASGLPAAAPATPQTAPDISMGYLSWDRFQLHIAAPDSDGKPRAFSLILCRSGIGWKVCGLDLPPSAH
jgi:hypothetical protein